MRKLILMFAAIAGLAIPLAAAPFFEQAPDVHSGGGSYLGVGIMDIDAGRAKVLKLGQGHGVEVSRVETNSPAAKAGIQIGDVLLEFNGQPLDGPQQLGHLVHETPPGNKVKILVWRAGKSETVWAVVEARKYRTPDLTLMWPPPPGAMTPDMPGSHQSWQSRMLGVECEPVANQLAAYFGVKQGVLIRFVISGTAADRAGLKAGDVVTKVGDHPVAEPREISEALRDYVAKKVDVAVTRDRRDVIVKVTFEDTGGPMAPQR
ncbi:MAG: PDZ domain-containing protein [Bryobacteraceae bacterium]